MSMRHCAFLWFFTLFSQHVWLWGNNEVFSWNEQKFESLQERDFWLAVPDWGEIEEDCYLYIFSKKGTKLELDNNSAFSGFAKGYIRSQQGEFFRALLEVKNGWVVTKKVWDNKGRKKILRSYSRGVLDGRYIDWYPNGNRKLDGFAMDGEKKGLWVEWYQNGEKKEEGVWKNGQADGIFEEWYPNGKKAVEQVFKLGHLETALVWKPDGSLCKESGVDNGEGLIHSYNLSGKKIDKYIIKQGKKVVP